MKLYKRRTTANTLLFLEDLLGEMPFLIQRIQTDRGLEFFAESVQKNSWSCISNSDLTNQGVLI